MNERDTHFANASRLLWDDLSNKLEFWIETAEDDFSAQRHEIISQFLYDFVYFLVESSYQHPGTFRGEVHQSVQMLPDMTERPNTSLPTP